MGYILVFTKQNKKYQGLIRFHKNTLFLAEKENSGHNTADTTEIESLLSRVRLARIRGFTEKIGAEKIIIKDVVYPLDEKDRLFYALAADELTNLTDTFYFVSVREPVQWDNIEEGIAHALISGTLSTAEREHVLMEMERMDEKQLLLLHFLLQRLSFNE